MRGLKPDPTGDLETPAEFLTDLLFQEGVCMTKNRVKEKLKTGGVAVGWT